MTVEEFIESSIEWNKIVGTQDIITQKAIVKQEKLEHQDAVSDKDVALECADVIWTNAWLREIAGSQALIHAAQVSHTEIKALARIADPKALEAVAKCNWSKIKKLRAQSAIVHWFESSVKALEAVKTKDNRQRFTSIYSGSKEASDDECFYWMVGTDCNNKDNPIHGKVLKPIDYRKAEDIYRELLG